MIEASFVIPTIKNLPLILLLFVLIFFYIFFIFFNNNNYKSGLLFNIESFFYQAAFFNIIYNYLFLFIFKISYVYLNKLLDKGIFDLPYLLYKYFKLANFYFSNNIILFIFSYIFYMFLGACFIVFFYLYSFLFYLII